MKGGNAASRSVGETRPLPCPRMGTAAEVASRSIPRRPAAHRHRLVLAAALLWLAASTTAAADEPLTLDRIVDWLDGHYSNEQHRHR